MTTELKNRVERIMSYCQTQADIYNNYQLGTKVVINGIYGAFGFSGFYFYNKNIAESVTKQGKHAILNAESLINKWAQKVWLKDKKTHKLMGVKIKPGYENISISSITRYIDTDSSIFSTIINISKEVIIVNNIAYNTSDIIQIIRNGVEMGVNASDIQKGDFISDDEVNNIEKTNKLTIEQLYNLGQNDMGSTLAGHESVDCKYDVLNIKQNSDTFERYYANVKRVIRHKVSKAKWSLKDEFGNEVIITNDHSLMVLRDGILQKVKPCEVDIDSDLLVIDDDGDVEIVGISRCEQIGYFDDEYVYDIEMNDETHTFVANNILVHNSIYSSYTDIIESTDWFEHQVWRLTKVNKQNDQKDFVYVSKGGYPTMDSAKEYFKVDEIDLDKYSYEIDEIEPNGREFCLTLNRVFMADFLKKIHDEYAEKQGTPNILDFELEGYLDAGIWLAKKKYIKNLTWAEPNIYYDSCTKIKPTGVEIAQTSSSPWVKKQLTDMVKWIFKQEEFSIKGMTAELKRVKEQFMLQSPEVICVNKGMNKYSEYVMNDTDEIELQPKAMVTIQGASFYNHLLNTNEKYKKKYGILSDSDKLCELYIKPTPKYTYWKKENMVNIKDYVKSPDMYKLVTDKKATIRPEGMGKPYEAFTDIMSKTQVEALSFPAGLYPKDLIISKGIEIDYERMFDLLILGPMNRIIEAMGKHPICLDMAFEEGLW